MTQDRLSGERAAVFFDIDRTLSPDPSLEWRFIAYLLAHDDIRIQQMGHWLGRFTRELPFRPRTALVENKLYLRGLPESLVEMWQRSLARGESSPDRYTHPRLVFFVEALERLAWHAARGDRIFLLSGTLAPLARVVAERLSQLFARNVQTCATELEARNGVWTGHLAGPHISSHHKALAIARLAVSEGLRLAESHAYADSFFDIPALESVGYPTAVNPSRLLRGHAARRHWPVVSWRTIEHAPPRSFSPSLDSQETP
jgi:HAD superfamily hydrolase (TIGR01490 family)